MLNMEDFYLYMSTLRTSAKEADAYKECLTLKPIYSWVVLKGTQA